MELDGLGLPGYYRWRSRSGCTICFFQQEFEWVRLKHEHPDVFGNAKAYRNTALDNASPFTWSHGEPLEQLARLERIAEIEAKHQRLLDRERALRRENLLLEVDIEPELDLDEHYGDDEGRGAYLICHK